MAALTTVLISLAFAAGYSSALGHRWVASDSLPSTLLSAATPAVPSPSTTPTSSDLKRAQEFQLLWEALDLLESDFYGTLPSQPAASRAAIRGVLQTLGDPNTALVDPELAKVYADDISGEFEGIGASVRTDADGYFTIVQPYDDSPAQAAGILPGDVVLEVDDQAVKGMATMNVISLIRGPAGTVVRLLIYRPTTGESFVAQVTRRKIAIQSVQIELRDGAMLHLRVRDFNALVPDQLHQALQSIFADASVSGIILDLRSNPGGLLSSAIEVASEFVGTGIITEERFRDGTVQSYAALPGGLATDSMLPLVVLVNQASASASEIVAGAIQASGRGLLVGEDTFGKGSVQIPRALSDGSQLRITIAHWFTPDGRDISAKGLQPDVLVPRTVEDYQSGLDPQLLRATDILRGE